MSEQLSRPDMHRRMHRCVAAAALLISTASCSSGEERNPSEAWDAGVEAGKYDAQLANNHKNSRKLDNLTHAVMKNACDKLNSYYNPDSAPLNSEIHKEDYYWGSRRTFTPSHSTHSLKMSMSMDDKEKPECYSLELNDVATAEAADIFKPTQISGIFNRSDTVDVALIYDPTATGVPDHEWKLHISTVDEEGKEFYRPLVRNYDYAGWSDPRDNYSSNQGVNFANSLLMTNNIGNFVDQTLSE